VCAAARTLFFATIIAQPLLLILHSAFKPGTVGAARLDGHTVTLGESSMSQAKQSNGNIFLIGPMGAGKTTTGKRLARTLDKQFIDSDREIELRTGATISLIFEIEGEAGFRAREAKLIAELAGYSNTVLSTGGGAILDLNNRKHLKSNGYVIYLRATIDKLLARAKPDKNRPLLHTDNPRAVLMELIEQRSPLYEQTADLIVDTDQRTARGVVNAILREIEKQ
jgi:shikimate kinase